MVCLSVCRGPETQITCNKTIPPNSRAQKLFRTSSFYFYFYVCFRAATAVIDGGGIFGIWRVGEGAQKLFKTSSSYFLLLLLRLFPRNNCRRWWGRHFWDLEGGWGGPKTIQDLKFLLLTFTFTSVFAQQLPLSMGEVFLGFGGWVRRFECAFFGLRV